tara:strand:- start:86 stop:397 length:312 start_codon:yes stop_codon:yes gene_type:complete
MSPLKIDFQTISFALSWLMQLVTLIVSVVALAQGGLPHVLFTIVVLELVVQIVEIVWYTTVGALVVTGVFKRISIAYRYMDWLVTTPIMMVRLTTTILPTCCS